MAERTGAGDPLRVIPLLWGAGRKTGRSGLTLDAILDAGTALATEQGIESVSMRKIAERLGAGTMSLYAHVPGKAELTDLMVDRAFAEVKYDPAALNGTQWRPVMEAVAEQNWQLFARHRWILEVDTTHPPLGPGTIGKYDAELAGLIGTGLDEVEMDQVLSLVLEHVTSTARQVIDAGGEPASARAADRDWWRMAGPVLAGFMDEGEYPNAARVGQAAGSAYGAPVDPRRAYTFGLERILDGVEALIATKNHATTSPEPAENGDV